MARAVLPGMRMLFWTVALLSANALHRTTNGALRPPRRQLGARPKTSWVANRTRACSVRITPDCPAAAGEASAANEHARFRSRANRPGCEPNEPPPSPRDAATARACSAALASPAAARRSRVTKAQHPRLRSATQDVLGRAPSLAAGHLEQRRLERRLGGSRALELQVEPPEHAKG